jgi:enoyl-CoA hydratase/carnithine racemase
VTAETTTTEAGDRNADQAGAVRTYEVLDVERDGHVATLFLDRPAKRNAMGPALWRELPLAIGALGADETVRAIVLAARGPHFTVGLDLGSLGEMVSDDDPAAGVSEA